MLHASTGELVWIFQVFGTRVISCSPREALYLLDGLLENDTVLRQREHYTDTHGFTEQLFGLCFCWATRLCRGCAIWGTNSSIKLIARYRWDGFSRCFTPGSTWI